MTLDLWILAGNVLAACAWGTMYLMAVAERKKSEENLNAICRGAVIIREMVDEAKAHADRACAAARYLSSDPASK